jgi:tetratricopeptide (TPR) repeat protein
LWLALPFFAVAAALGAITIHFQAAQGLDPSIVDRGLLERAAQAGINLWFYLYKTFVPLDLATVYPEIRVTGASALSLLPLVAWVAGLATLWVLRPRPWARGALMAAAFFTLNLLPVLGVLNMAWTAVSPAADHFLYIPMMGALAWLGAGIAWARRSQSAVIGRTVGLAAVGVVACLVVLTWSQVLIYQTNLSLWAYNVRVRPTSAAAHANYGLVLKAAGVLPEAEGQWMEARRLMPGNYVARFELGTSSLAQQRYAAAADEFAAVLAIHPEHRGAILGLAQARRQMGDRAGAARAFEDGMKASPGDAELPFAYGVMLEDAGRLADAEAQYRRAAGINPGLVAAHYNLGNCLQMEGKTSEAIAAYHRALELDPRKAEAWFNLAMALHAAGKDDQAQAAFAEAVRLKPELAKPGGAQ